MHTSPCPTWCDPTRDHESLDAGRLHERHMGGFWIRELRTATGRVVRPADDLMEVFLEAVEGDSGALDPVVAVRRVTLGREVRLTGGEARSLSAMLAAAADRLEGLRD